MSSPSQAAEALVATAPGATPWWQEMVLYENHLPSLRDGSGDGIGDLEGLIQSLDYLAHTLGVTAVWVGPFFRSPLLDMGFDITDYLDVEPVFGDLATFDRLISEAHRRDLKIIVDYIPNHTSDQHPWFVESRSSRDESEAGLVRVGRRRPGPGSTRTTGSARSVARSGNGTSPRASSIFTLTLRSNQTSTGVTPGSGRRCWMCCGSGWIAASMVSASTWPTC